MKKQLILLFTASFLLSGTCVASDSVFSTAYKHRTLFRDGYHDTSIGTDTFQVTFEGNSFTSKETAVRYALVRAAEVTKNKGDNYFVILDKLDASTAPKSWSYWSPSFSFFSKQSSMDSWVEYLTINSINSISQAKPSFTLMIKTFKERPVSDSYLAVDDIIESSSDILKQRGK